MFRCHPLKWLWGLLPLGLLGLLVVATQREPIEQDLAARAQAALSAAGYEWAQPQFEARDAVIGGEATSEPQQREAQALLDRVFGVRVVEDRTTVLAQVSPYTWAAASREGALVLRGHVPSENVRKTVIGMAKAKFPNIRVEDRLKVAGGAGDTTSWLSGVSFGLEQLAQLNSGSVAFSDRDMSIVGQARDLGAYKSVKRAIYDQRPNGVVLASDKVTPPVVSPFIWGAELGAADGGQTLTLRGYVPDEASRAAVFTAAKSRFPKAAIVDQTVVAAGAPQDWQLATQYLISGLAGLRSGTADSKDTDLTVNGVAEDNVKADTVIAVLDRGTPKGYRLSRTIGFAKTLPPPLAVIAPYSFAAEKSGDGKGVIVLTGYVPNEATRAAIVARATALSPGATITDQLQLGAGAPSDFDRAIAERGLVGLASLDSGRLAVVDRALTLTGEIGDRAAKAAAEQAVTTGLPQGYVGSTTVRLVDRSDYQLEAEVDGRQWTLAGSVPDEALRDRLKAAAQRARPGVQIVDSLTVREGAPNGFGVAAERAIAQLGRLDQGSLAMAGQTVRMAGQTRDRLVFQSARETIAVGLPAGFTGTPDIRLIETAAPAVNVEELAAAVAAKAAKEAADREAARKAALEAEKAEAAKKAASLPGQDSAEKVAVDECQTLLNSILVSGTIEFAVDSAELRPESFATLLGLAHVANRCPDTRIEIGGHTDSDGSPTYNRALSQRRAETVVAFLGGEGVDARRLTAVGYGEDKPVADNASDEGKARNRRIEFVIAR